MPKTARDASAEATPETLRKVGNQEYNQNLTGLKMQLKATTRPKSTETAKTFPTNANVKNCATNAGHPSQKLTFCRLA